jgi:hypothetical protein
MRRTLGLGATGLFLFTRAASAADAATPGAVSAPYPTLENISIEWALTNDDNANAAATVRFRKAGGTAYRDGLPLFRVPAGSGEGFDWTSKLSGSLFGLEPDSEYEIELTLTDPDGGDTTEMLTARTRALPTLPAAPHNVAVTPSSIADALDGAGPGDVLVLADGTYDEIVVSNDGSATEPLVLRAANPGKAVVEGDVRLDGRSHVWTLDLTIHGKIKANDADSLVIRGTTIETQDDGIVAYGDGLTSSVIMNNVITGSTLWRESSLGVDGDNVGEGVQITGAGNVVAYNRVSGFRDCLSLLEDDEAVNQVSDDFYGNDLSSCADDAIEADFAMGNVRVYGNRIRDSFMGVSSQPGLGGPTYFVRNVMYNVLFQAFKLQRSSVGDVALHNTVVKSGDAFSVNTDDIFSRATFRNNLFIGGPGGEYNGYDSGPGDIMMLPSADDSCSFDYDGYGSIGTGQFSGRVASVRFDGLDELRTQTTEAHAIEVDLDVFEATVAFPADPFSAPATPSLLLADDSAALDRGIVLPTINDAFTGDAPDLGAFELGSPDPTYGPGGDIGSGGTDPTGSAGDSSGGTAGTALTAGQGGTNPSNGGSPSSGRGGTSTAGSPQGGTSTAGRNGSAGANSGATSGTSTSGQGGTTNTAGSPSAGGNGESDEDSGCGCRVPHRPSNAASTWTLALALALTLRRRRPRT